MPSILKPLEHWAKFFSYLKLCLATAIQNFKCLKICVICEIKSQHIPVFQDWRHILFSQLIVQLLIKTQKVYCSRHQCSKGWDVNVDISRLNPLTVKLFNLNFHPLEVVSRWRDPQLQVREKYTDLTKWRSTLFKSCWSMSQSHYGFNMRKRRYWMW